MIDSPRYTLIFGFTVISIMSTGQASAQALEEVIVTAQKREQSIQDVSVSITAFTEQELKEYGFQNLNDVTQHAPNVHITSYFNSGRPEVSMRGISMQNLSYDAYQQSSVGIYTDEVYIGNSGGQLAQMFDLERVEILRGPQGTLYGRNSTGGAVNFISRRPSLDEPSVDAALTVANYDRLDVELGASVPLSETLALRVAGISRNADGFTTNEFSDTRTQGPGGNVENDANNTDLWAARALLLWRPSENMEWVLKVHGSESKSRSPAPHAIGAGRGEPNTITGYQENPDFHTLSHDFEGREVSETFGVSLTGEFDIGDITVKSITGYADINYSAAWDRDATPADITTGFNLANSDQFSQELRLESTLQNGVNWIAGFYYFDETLDGENIFTLFMDDSAIPSPDRVGDLATNELKQDTLNWAVYGDLRWPVYKGITLFGGLRFTDEEKDFSNLSVVTNILRFLPGAPVVTETNIDETVEESWSELTWRAGLEWSPTDNTLAYISYSRGFKGGGFNGNAFRNPVELEPYDPEFTDAYEIGIKTSWFDNRLTLNGSFFYNDLEDFHTLVVEVPPAGAPLFFVRNAPSAETYGAEFQLITRPVERLYASFGIGLVETEFTEFAIGNVDAAGNEFPNAPSLTANGMIKYDIPIRGRGVLSGSTLTPRFEISFIGDRWANALNRPILDGLDEYYLANASLTWRSADGRMEVTGWGRNITDEEYLSTNVGNFRFVSGSATAFAGTPRSYGITFRYNYE